MGDHVLESTACYNCGAMLSGAYCGTCGQKAMPLNPGVHEFLHELTHELLHVDGKIFRSVKKLLVAPGFLTAEHFQPQIASSGNGAKGRGGVDVRVRALVEKIWDYHHLRHELSHADAILVLCSHDTVVAERGAQLFLDGWAPLLIFSGGLGMITRHLWKDPEADRFADIAVRMGVPRDQILIENRSTNTGENVLFTRRLLAERDLDPRTFIVVQKPYMERRSYATFKKVWPGKDIIVTSPQVSLDTYLQQCSHGALSADDVISIMVGDLQRIRLYPEKGFQIPQEIPADVWAAYEELVRLGYDKRLLSPSDPDGAGSPLGKRS
jgi:uncharacterized SAM-binding protein YcdF (DUF218 family)